MESDRISVLSKHQILFEERNGLLSSLPLALEQTERSIGITVRSGGTLSRAAEMLIGQLHRVADELQQVRSE